MKNTKNKPLTLDQQAKEIIQYWQKQLRLMDWNISIEVIDKPDDGSFGRNRMNPDYQTSKIVVANPANIPPDWWGIRDFEVTIVHELLHIRLLYALGTKKSDHHAEMAIETLAQCLVANKRGIDPGDLE